MNLPRPFFAATAALLLSLPAALSGQVQTTRASVRAVPASGPAPSVLDAVRLSGPDPVVDGRLDDEPWANAPVAEGFTQFEPAEGDAATERTVAKVLYGADALFVGIRAYDRDPSAIAGQLTRRDLDSYSDQLAVVIDSYFDRRTAFQFAVNPLGVKSDEYRFNDTNEDRNWDAVWDVATTVDAEGWTAEFRIPYSQLRFKAGSDQTWGINFLRVIARRQETDAWAPTRRSESAVVSRFGELRGLQDLAPPRHLELMPYSLAKLDRQPRDASDPFWSANAVSGQVGADVKYGVTSNLTLDLTLNPDFGQVEADPSQVNLSAYETFLSEQRPFFVEGSNLFSFSDNAVFYSRRIGRPPEGTADAGDDGHVQAPDHGRIVGAAKLSGKTPDGWAVGVLDAVTAERSAEVAPVIGPRHDVPVEPLTNYWVSRVTKDFHGGRTTFGMVGTSVFRDPDVAAEYDLRDRAYTLGADLRHRFSRDRWELQAWMVGSRIEGSTGALIDTQLSSAHYFQRPDAHHLVLDSTRTSLSGQSSGLNINKIAGGHWRLSAYLNTRSPGFDSNDLGFMGNADYISSSLYVGWSQSSPQSIFRRWQLNWNYGDQWTFGWEEDGMWGNVNGNFLLKNFWGGNFGFGWNGTGLSNNVLRGGPLYRKEPSWHSWYGFSSDNRKAVQLIFDGGSDMRTASHSWDYNANPQVKWRPSGQVNLQLGANWSRNEEDVQYIDTFGEGASAAYVFARVNQHTLGLTARADLAFTPTLTLQVYAQPFVASGIYSNYRQVADSKAERYADRWTPLHPRLDDDSYYLSLAGDPTEESFDQPDFNTRQFNSNTVLRWEYRPGSALFLVWAQARDSDLYTGLFRAPSDMHRLFTTAPRNIFMVKVSYWLNP